MANIMLWADNTGAIVEYDTTGGYTPTVTYPRSLEIDPDTNGTLARDLRRSIAGYTLGAGGALRKDGVVVIVNAEGQNSQDVKAFRQLQAKLEAGTALTNAEVMFFLKVTGRFMIAVYKQLQTGPGGAGAGGL